MGTITSRQEKTDISPPGPEYNDKEMRSAAKPEKPQGRVVFAASPKIITESGGGGGCPDVLGEAGG